MNARSSRLAARFFLLLLFLCVALPRPGFGQVGGTLDPAFNTSVAGNEVIRIATQPDDKIILVGDFSQINGVAHTNVVRLNADGTPDGGFVAVANDIISTVAVQADGRIILGGYFTKINGITHNRIARLNSDGSLDSTFNANANGAVYRVALQADGRVLVTGDFSQFNGVARNCVVRLNTDGTLDSSFIVRADTDAAPVVVQADSKIIIGGYFNQVNGTTRNYVARLNSDGSVDSGFVANADNVVNDIAVQPDGKTLIGGNFSQVNGLGRNYVARLNADGSVDNGFAANPNAMVVSAVVQTDGKILLGGRFTQVNGVTRNRLARLNADGSLDTNFNVDFDYWINSVKIQNDGKIIVGGVFASVNSVAHSHVVRLIGDPAQVQFSAATYNTTETASFVTLTVNRLYFGSGAVSVNYVTRDGSAAANFDYQAAQGTLSWPDSDLSPKFINVPIRDRGLSSGSGTFYVDLSAPTGNAILAAPATAAVTIAYTDAPVANIQSVSLLSPPTNLTVTQNATIDLYADVEATANTLASVAFSVVDSAGAVTDLGGFTSQRGHKTWQPATAGDFTLKVVATDTQGQSRQATNPIHVLAPAQVGAAPQASLFGGLDGRTVAQGDTVTVVAQAVDSDGNPLQNAQIYVDGVAVPTSPVATNSLDAAGRPLFGPNAAGGSKLVASQVSASKAQQLVTVTGTKANGVSAVSSGANLFSRSSAGTPPSCAISNVTSGDTVAAGQSVSVAATAGSAPLVKVELYADQQSVGTLSAAPFDFTLPALGEGAHALSAIATDSNGVARVSASVIVTATGAHPAFFAGEVALGQGVYFLQFASTGRYFGYYEYLSDPHFVYHFDMGFEYWFDAGDGSGGIYFYDFASSDFFYTSPTFGFPYLYDFGLASFLYYFPDPANPQRYNTDGVRIFYNLTTGGYLTK